MNGVEVADKNEIHELFCENVRNRVSELGISQAELARRMGVSPQYVWSYLTGSKEPGLSVVGRFADALGCRPFDLLVEEKVSA